MAISEKKIIKRFEEAQDSLVLQSSDLSLETIAKMVETEAIDTSPHYQRRERWAHHAQAELIESFLLNVPVPPVYLAEDDFGTYSVIDGKQRITAVHAFLRNKFTLERLSGFEELNGLSFQDLPKPLQNALTIRPYLRVVTLLKQTDPELKYEVFTRLNTGGQPLLPQEIRNALYRGPLNDALHKLAENQFLRKQLKIHTQKESAYTEMLDVEMALRFFTFRKAWQAFSGDSRRSMDEYMAANRKATTSSISEHKSAFGNALQRCEALWGSNAFKRFTGLAYRDQFLAAIFDAEMIAASELSEKSFKQLTTKKVAIDKATRKLFEDTKFEEAVRASTNTPSRVKYRIEAVKNMLSNI